MRHPAKMSEEPVLLEFLGRDYLYGHLMDEAGTKEMDRLSLQVFGAA